MLVLANCVLCAGVYWMILEDTDIFAIFFSLYSSQQIIYILMLVYFIDNDVYAQAMSSHGG